MTVDLPTAEIAFLMGFLCGGALLGIVGGWMDQLLAFIKKG